MASTPRSRLDATRLGKTARPWPPPLSNISGPRRTRTAPARSIGTMTPRRRHLRNSLTSEMHQRFDRVHQELTENRERMAKLEGSLDGFLAGRRDRDAA